MVKHRSALLICVLILSAALAPGCSKGAGSRRVNSEDLYAGDGWNGVAYADYRDFNDARLFGPFETSEQCADAIRGSGAVASDAGVYECCMFDPSFDWYGDGSQLERVRICRNNFTDEEIEELCADPADMCNARGDQLKGFIDAAQSNADIHQREVEESLAVILDAQSDADAKSAAKERFIRATYIPYEETLADIYARIRADSGQNSREDLEGKLASALAAATDDEDRDRFGDLLTGINGPLIEDALKKVLDPALALIEQKASAAPTLEPGTVVDAVLFSVPGENVSTSNHVFDRMTGEQIAARAEALSTVGVIRVSRSAEENVFYTCDSGGVGNAYRIRHEMSAIDLKSNRVAGVKTLIGAPPPERIKAYGGQCDGVGEPPDWTKIFTVAD